jgi:hypothetical protein
MSAMNGQALHTLIAAIVRRTWLFALATVVVCAAFAASAVTALVEASYLAPSAEAAKLPAAAVVKEPVRVPRNGDGFVARNMFCATCTASFVEPGSTDSFVPNAILIATSVGDDPRATVRVPVSEAQGSYGLDDKIPGVGKVVRIGWRSIDVLDDSNRRGKLDLLDQTAAAGAGAATSRVAAAEPDPFEGRIKKIDDHTFEVDRDLVKELVSGAVKPGAMRVVPVPDGNGGMKGLKLYGIKGTSLAGTVGLQNGDTLVAINNNKIQNAQSLLDVYTHIDTMNVVELDGTRADKPLALTLRLR